MELKKKIPYKRASNKSKVIINADDFGITKGVNKAIYELFGVGILTSTSVMSNMPDYKDIVNLKDRIGIGVHFNLTVGTPITEPYKIPTLVDERGNFFDLSRLLRKTKLGKVSRQEIEIELDAQIKRLIDIEIQPDHVDSHESLLKYPFFSGIIKRLAKKYGIMAVRTYSPRKFDYTRLLSPKKFMISLYLAFNKLLWKLDGFHVTDKYDSLIKVGLVHKTALERLNDIFRNLPHGVLELVVHPGYCDGNNNPLGEYVYEREVELQALLSDEFKKIILNSGARLISFKDIPINTL
ncbi:MAG: carbohydrate deacetylase [Cytophagaceae bacterium]